jgi:hypothetical protein
VRPARLRVGSVVLASALGASAFCG